MSLLLALLAAQASPADLEAILKREILQPGVAVEELQAWLDPKIPSVPAAKTAEEWRAVADRLREDALEKVVFRGEARRWRDAATKVEWAGDIPGGPGYAIRKVRYEALPGMWIPALLYVPDGLSSKVPVHLAVNGHDGKGKAADYKQIRCINLAKRGMLVLNVEWFGMGQLRGPGYGHYTMNQLDLCGTSGLAPFFLAMRRGLDLLLSLEHADPARVAVHGLSGGGWQTIFISGLDPRVTLSNPVAGYSSYRTRLRHFKDLGDSEQTPSDLATVVDYAHLTAMRAPRPTLLTFNGKDNCCFEAGYAMKPLEDAARPVFDLFGRGDALRTHVNDDPGDHNFGIDNRQALYRMVADSFGMGDGREIPCADEIKTADLLEVPLPADNATFNSLARSLADGLPRAVEPSAARERLRSLLRAKEWAVEAEKLHESPKAVYWKLRVGGAFTVPCVELPGKGAPILLVGEAGRAALAKEAAERSSEGRPVLVADPFFYGESKLGRHDFLLALLAAAVGERALGIQASQLAAVARWARERHGAAVELDAVGPRASLGALSAAALETEAVGALVLRRAYGSLKDLLEQNVGVNKAPEPFVFGLLEAFDMPSLKALVAPRPVTIR